MFSLRSYCKFCVLCDAKVNSPRCYGMLTLNDTSPSRALCRLQNEFPRMYWPFLFLFPSLCLLAKMIVGYCMSHEIVSSFKKIETLLLWRLSACRETKCFLFIISLSLFSQKTIGISLSPTLFGSLSSAD